MEIYSSQVDMIYVVYTRVTYLNFDPTYKHFKKKKTNVALVHLNEYQYGATS